MKKLLPLMMIVVMALGCADEQDACSHAQSMGFTNCQVTEVYVMTASLHGCHDEEDRAFEITATNPANRTVNTVVCCRSLPLSCTLRN